jgi:hypothetical protein
VRRESCHSKTGALGSKRQMRTLVTVLMGFLLLVSKSARAQGVVLALPLQDQQLIAARLGPRIVGEALPSKPIDDASIYFPLENRVPIYQISSGPEAGNLESAEIARVRRPRGRLAWRFRLSPSLTAFIAQTTDLSLVMSAVSDQDEGLVVVTRPGNPFIPKGMQPGETRSISQRVSVNYLDNPTEQDYSGTVNETYTYVGTYKVTVPAGTFPAVLFRATAEGKVGPAYTRDVSYNFFAPKVGMVAMIMQENVTALWIFHIDTATGRVLVTN